MTQTTEVMLRAPTLADVDAVVDLINEESVRLTGSPDVEIDGDEVRGAVREAARLAP